MADAYVMSLKSDGFTLRYKMNNGWQSDYFIQYRNFPLFKAKPFRQITNVKLYRHNHFFWPDLDVDLTVTEILEQGKGKAK